MNMDTLDRVSEDCDLFAQGLNRATDALEDAIITMKKAAARTDALEREENE